MNSRKKTLWIGIVTLIGLLGISYLITSTLLLRGLTKLEKQYTHQNVQRVLEAISDRLSTLNAYARNWATRRNPPFDEDSDFISTYASDPSFFTELQLNMILLVDSFGWAMRGRAFDWENQREMALPEGLQEYLSPGNLLLEHSGARSSRAGLVLLPEGPVLVASRPVPEGDEANPLSGILILGRYLDATEIDLLARKTRLDLTVHRWNDPQAPDDFRAAQAFLSREPSPFVQTHGEDHIAGYTVLRDIYGKPALLLRVAMPGDLLKTGKTATHYFALLLLGTALVTGVVLLVLSEQGAFSPLDQLGQQREGVDRNKKVIPLTPSERVNNRLLKVAGAVNDRLEALENSYPPLNATSYELKKNPKWITGEGNPDEAILSGITGRELAGELKKVEAEKREIEAQLRKAQRLEAAGLLAEGMAHEFNDVLGTIQGYTQLALMESSKESRARYHLDNVMKAGRHAQELVKQILAVSLHNEQKRELVQVSLVTKEAVSLFKKSLPACIEVREDIVSTGLVLADPAQIRQIVMNLCAHAHHTMWGGRGTIQVILKDTYLDENLARKHSHLKPGSYLNLTVKAGGEGMDAPAHTRHFDSSSAGVGSGDGNRLRLPVVHSIVNTLRGAIEAQNQSGQDSSFHVLLPRVGYMRDSREPRKLIRFPSPRERILFVDDDEALTFIGQEMLKRFGYNVTAKKNSVEALDLFRNGPDQFDLVITDQMMPNMTGLELAKEFLNIRPNIPIILCTGMNERIIKKKAQETGIREFLTKPLVTHELAATIRTVLSGNGQNGN